MILSVETLDERVDYELSGLPVDMRARFKRIGALMIVNGPKAFREPYVKHLEGKLLNAELSYYRYSSRKLLRRLLVNCKLHETDCER